ncbi:autotransporter beta-domain protein, partial [Chlamydia psittaci 02DC21]
RIS